MKNTFLIYSSAIFIDGSKGFGSVNNEAREFIKEILLRGDDVLFLLSDNHTGKGQQKITEEIINIKTEIKNQRPYYFLSEPTLIEKEIKKVCDLAKENKSNVYVIGKKFHSEVLPALNLMCLSILLLDKFDEKTKGDVKAHWYKGGCKVYQYDNNLKHLLYDYNHGLL